MFGSLAEWNKRGSVLEVRDVGRRPLLCLRTSCQYAKDKEVEEQGPEVGIANW